jgi:hypothetical protein
VQKVKEWKPIIGYRLRDTQRRATATVIEKGVQLTGERMNNEYRHGIGTAEEYLTVTQLAARIKFSPQTIYNMISSEKFVKGKHYIKPSPERKYSSSGRPSGFGWKTVVSLITSMRPGILR